MRRILPCLLLTVVTLAQNLPAEAQTLGNPFGNPNKPVIENNDENLEGERTNYCKTKADICFVPNGGYIDNPCVCENNGRYDKGRFIKKGQLN